MEKILYIKASPRTQRSYANRVGDAFLEKYTELNPDVQVDTLELFKEQLPAFDGSTLNAKYRILHGEDATDEEKTAWQVVEKIIERFKSADKYLITLPMWNFGIPYELKHYIDILVQPTYTFEVTPDGYAGLVKGKPILMVYARGGDYEADSPADFQQRYMEMILGFIGFTDISTVTVQPTLAAGPDAAKQALDNAIAKAKNIAVDF